MIDERFARTSKQFEPRAGGFQRLAQRRDRKHRNQRIGAALLAVIVTMAAGGLLVSSFRSDVVPADRSINPDNIDRLGEIWSTAIRGGSGPPVVLGGTVYVVAGHELAAYPIACTMSCTPTWTADAGEPIEGSSLVAGSSELFAEGRDRLIAFPVACPASSCGPDWTAPVDHGYRVEYADGVVYELGSSVQAFAERCRTDGGACKPSWTARRACAVAGDGVVALGCSGYGPLQVFAAGCGPAVHGCRALWTGERVERPELISDGVVYVSRDVGVAAYPVDCTAACHPSWWNGSESFLIGVADGLAYVQETMSHVVVAYPSPCGDNGPTCAALWRSAPAKRFPTDRLLTPAADLWSTDAGVGGAAVGMDHRYVELTPACRSHQTCSSYVADTGVNDWVSPVRVGDGVAFVGAFGSAELRAYPLTCPVPCRPTWTWTVTGATGWSQPVIVRTKMVAISAGPSGSVLHVFGLSSTHPAGTP